MKRKFNLKTFNDILLLFYLPFNFLFNSTSFFNNLSHQKKIKTIFRRQQETTEGNGSYRSIIKKRILLRTAHLDFTWLITFKSLMNRLPLHTCKVKRDEREEKRSKALIRKKRPILNLLHGNCHFHCP